MADTVTARWQPKDETNRSLHPSQAWLERIGALELAFLQPLGVAVIACVDAWADYAQDWAGFVADRVRQDVRTLHAILHCRKPEDLQAIQADFFQTAIDSYLAEAGRLSTLAEQATRAMTAAGPVSVPPFVPRKTGHALAV